MNIIQRIINFFRSSSTDDQYHITGKLGSIDSARREQFFKDEDGFYLAVSEVSHDLIIFYGRWSYYLPWENSGLTRKDGYDLQPHTKVYFDEQYRPHMIDVSACLDRHSPFGENPRIILI